MPLHRENFSSAVTAGLGSFRAICADDGIHVRTNCFLTLLRKSDQFLDAQDSALALPREMGGGSGLPELQRRNGIAKNGSAALQTLLLIGVQPQWDSA
jgi:hypothetical protein